MSTELNLRFPDAQHVIVRLAPGDDGSGQLAFTNPITDKDLRDIAYFIEFLNPNSASTQNSSRPCRLFASREENGPNMLRIEMEAAVGIGPFLARFRP
jgi:hypothetical protein